MLADGNAPAEAFPGDELADLAADILRHHADAALQYSALEGYRPLREVIASWLTADGVEASADEVIIVTGAKQNLEMTARALCSPGDRIVVGAPTYYNGIKIFQRTGVELLTVPNDGDGIDVDAVESLLTAASRRGEPLPRLIYDVPDFQNPTGTVLIEARREKLVGLAARHGILVLEDNPYRWTRQEGESLPPVKHFDRDGVIISTGTFAKILGPGLRLGWVHAKRSILDRILPYKVDGGTSPMCQMLAYEFYKSPGSLDRHLARVRDVLRPKRDAMLEALEISLGGLATWSHPLGGYYVWVTMGAGFDTDALATQAVTAGVEIFRGSMFFASKSPPRRSLRLCFSYENVARIHDGIAVLGRCANAQAAGLAVAAP
jgi:2-aminoadipate transaminase